jgi:2-amino-4-hydroxy-6-hydroxymethyldihydropteridine diphosphokinase
MVDRAVTVAIALGSNLGDREAHLDFAIVQLSALLAALHASPFFETAPVDVEGIQPDFLNAAVVGQCTLSPRTLLDSLLAIEQMRGRERPHPGAARSLDLDLILYGDLIVEEPGLVVPHPRFRTRRFVLDPLAAIGRDLIDPVTGLTVGQLAHISWS